MPDKFIGRIKEAAADAGMKGNLSHEHEQRHHCEAVTAEYIVEILGQHPHATFPGYDIGKSDNP